MLEEEFNKYVSNYNLENNSIKLKYDHSFRVMQLQVKYAKKLNFSKEDREIAKVIGLLHDIGRFEQLRVYNSFNDCTSIDHADYSIEQLFDKNEIERFHINKEWYPIIKYAIKNHNKMSLEPCNDERAIMHAKLIRDTDKIDIIYLFGNLAEYKQTPTNDPISKEVLNAINSGKQVRKKDQKNRNEHIIAKFAFAFDINNDITLKEFKKNYTKYYKSLNNELFNEPYNKIMNYINERIDNYERTR